VSAPDKIPPVTPSGKFFSRLDHKFFLKAMRLQGVGDAFDFNQKIALRKRLADLERAHTTAVVLTQKQADSVLGLAAQTGLYALVEIETEPEALLDRARFRQTLATVARTINLLRGHRALIGYLVDCPVEPAALRHHGLDLLRRRLHKLLQVIRRTDRHRLVALKHRPATAALAQLDEDFIYAVMPAISPTELRDYVIRLHNLAEARPLVVEFGEGLPGQDELVACAFGLGAAGVVAPATQPAASSGSLGIRMLSAGELLPFITLNGSCPPAPAETPMVSVVICAYNAERTMRQCLESLRKLDYPNYEIIIVDDGSRDRTAEIAMDFPEFRLIRQPNKGLSVARNVGMQAAHGELIAYTDSDCVVDPHWLNLIVRAIADGRFDGCGGPNYAPHEDGWVEACVAASPGAPCHVLTADDRAEHLAGCNMVFRKTALLAIGGFDPQFISAGDDVDICWRMLDAGFTLGFCPAAFVWHFRRNTIKAYYGQQRGYGRAEAMLYLKYPDRFNPLGQIKWRGTIPGLSRTIPGGDRSRVTWTRRHTDFQRVHEAPLSVLKFIPLTLEWNLAAAAVLAASASAGITLVPALVLLAMSPVWALYYAARTSIEKCHDGIRARMLVAILAYSAPIARTIARYRCRNAARQKHLFDSLPRQRPVVQWLHRTVRLAYWNETWTTRDAILERVGKLFARMGHPALTDGGWNDFDLAVEPKLWTRIELKTADEEHEGGRLKNHIAARVRLSMIARAGMAAIGVGTLGATALGFGTLATALGAIALGAAICAASEAVESGRLAYRAIEQCAFELNLAPLGIATAAARIAAVSATTATAAAGPERSAEAAQPAAR
jgi:glycosyltransferase involved in cell wall biosynthesis